MNTIELNNVTPDQVEALIGKLKQAGTTMSQTAPDQWRLSGRIESGLKLQLEAARG